MVHVKNSSVDPSFLTPSDPLGKRFTSLFPYLWRFIYKDALDQPWQTEIRYRIDPRNLWADWQNPKRLIGVRFGEFTNYGLADIDQGSCYHPDNDPSALARLRAALEEIGIYRTLLIRSSDSGGLHLYFPLPAGVPSYGFALALRDCIQSVGFNLAPGHLELFPNCKTFAANGTTDYQGHRLPLQLGSYLLDEDCQVITNDLGFFLNSWDSSAAGNDLDELNQAIAAASAANRIQIFKTKGRSITQWREDSERVISEGWTGEGQTNDLIKLIARHGRVFEELAGEELIEFTIETAINCPGYKEFCKHQRSIHKRARDWAILIERRYVPYSTMVGRIREPQPDQRLERNSQSSSDAIERIKAAVLSIGGTFTRSIRELAAAISNAARCSLGTLYKYRKLWHPDDCSSNSQTPLIELDSDFTQESTQETHKSLKPSPSGLLHPLGTKKVVNAVTDFFRQSGFGKHTLKLPPLPPGFDFGKRRRKKTPWKPLPGRRSRLFRLVYFG